MHDLPVRPGGRNEQVHEANLYDIDAKYGDGVSAEEVAARTLSRPYARAEITRLRRASYRG